MANNKEVGFNYDNPHYKAHLELGVCPSCGSDEVEGGSVEIDGIKALQKCVCHACEQEWCDVYVLALAEPVNQ